tara:strand:+ start:364 stop:951 length:588 start_codon:yes stop_codon:yes gene_type:complete
MKTTVTDDLGTYEINTKMKPQELINTENSAIYLNLFDNGERDNACQYKLSLAVVDENKTSTDWHCPILNKWEPGRWLRQVPEQVKDNTFYRQMQVKLNELRRSEIPWEKSPSAGFFKAPRSKGMESAKRPNLPNAIAMLAIAENDNPLVMMRFMDFTFNGFLEPTGKKFGPKWSVCLVSSYKPEEAEELDYSEYF